MGVEALTPKMSMNPFCEIAVEEGIRLKERGIASEVVAVSIGPPQCKDSLRTALAMGVNRALHVEVSASDYEFLSTPFSPELLPGGGKSAKGSFSSLNEPLLVARVLAAVSSRENPSLWLLGKQAIDDDYSQTPQLLAGLLNCGQVSAASRIERVTAAEDTALSHADLKVTCEVDEGSAQIVVGLPAVVSTDLRLNTPRFPSLPAVLKAKKLPIETLQLSKLLLDHGGSKAQAQLELVEIIAPPPRRRGVMVKDAAELVDKLRNEAKVI